VLDLLIAAGDAEARVVERRRVLDPNERQAGVLVAPGEQA